MHKTNYARNSVHELPSIGRVIIVVPYGITERDTEDEDNNGKRKVTWIPEELERSNYSDCKPIVETWGGDLWLHETKQHNAVVLDTTRDFDARLFHEANKPFEYQRVYVGAQADGLLIQRGSSAGFLTADDPAVVLADYKKDLLLAVCAGRDSLLDRKKIYTGKKSRENFSVIDSAMKVLREHGSRPENLFVGVYCGIGPRHFAHSFMQKGHKRKNRQLFSFLRKEYGSQSFKKVNQCSFGPDLFEIIVAQLAYFGVKRNQIHHDGVDTGEKTFFCTSREKKVKSELASHRRGTNSRNFIVVQHEPEPFDVKKNERHLLQRQIRENQQLLGQ